MSLYACFNFRVYGIKGLRVVDCSVFPLLPSGHTNPMAIMAAEKAADLIKYSWSNYQETAEKIHDWPHKTKYPHYYPYYHYDYQEYSDEDDDNGNYTSIEDYIQNYSIELTDNFIHR